MQCSVNTKCLLRSTLFKLAELMLYITMLLYKFTVRSSPCIRHGMPNS